MCLFYKLWEMEDRKASCKQFVVNGLKHVKLLACSFKQHGHTCRLKCLHLFVYTVRDEKKKSPITDTNMALQG